MHVDPATPIFVTVIFVILILGFVMQKLKQPVVIAYLLVGIILGPNFIGVITDQSLLSRVGAFGVIFLMFFIGMEISPKRLIENWAISVCGTIFKILVSFGLLYCLGYYFSWSIHIIILFSFIISLSSTAVTLKLLQDWQELDTRVGQDVLGILLVQDVIFIPMLIIIGIVCGATPSIKMIVLQIVGGICVIAAGAYLTVNEHINIPILRRLAPDHESQVFLSLMLCFGLALITAAFELSTAVGAFLAGMIISSAKEAHWVHTSLSPFKTIFLALFFVSIGMLVNLKFVSAHGWQVFFLVAIVFLSNTGIYALILYFLGEEKKVSLYGGAMLSQIGEFGFILTLIGFQNKLLNEVSYQLLITTISFSLLLSPLWIVTTRKIIDKANIKILRLSKRNRM